MNTNLNDPLKEKENDLLNALAKHMVIVKNDLIMPSCIFRLEFVCT